MSVYIYTVSITVRRCLKSHICILVKLDLSCCLARDRKSPPQRRNVTKEVDLARNLFHKQPIYHQKSINIQQSFRLGRCKTLYHEGRINVNKNLHKAVYSFLQCKRRDRRCLFSISLKFYQTILESSQQTKFMFNIKKLV